MAGNLRPGLRVGTTHFGPGVVTKATKGGALVRLEGLGGYEIEVAATELSPLGASDEGGNDEREATGETRRSSLVLPSGPTRSSLPGDLAARRAVEALRFGLVPYAQIEELTLGVDELRRWTLDNLPDTASAGAAGERPRVAAVVGPFGTGKSHTMALIRHVAGEAGYVTARVEVDGGAISLAKPEPFLFQLWQGAAVPDLRSSTPILDLYARAIDAGQPPPAILAADVSGRIDRVYENYAVVQHLQGAGRLDEHAYALDALLSSSTEFTANEVNRLVGGWLKGPAGYIHARRMVGQSVADRPHDLIAALAGHATIARLAGYRGLVVTVDEFEVEQVPSRANYERVKGQLAALVAWVQGRGEVRPAPLGLFFATVEAGEGGDDAIGAMLRATGGGHYRLAPRSREQRLELARRLHRLYGAAYALEAEFDPALVERIEARFADEGFDDSGLIRAFIKRYVGALDACYGPAAP